MAMRMRVPTAMWIGAQIALVVGRTSAVGGAKKVGHVVAHYKLKGDQNEHGPVQRDLARAVADRRRRDFLRILSPHRPSASL